MASISSIPVGTKGYWARSAGSVDRIARAAAPSNGEMVKEINPDGSDKALDAAAAAKTHEVGLPRGWRATAKPGIIYIHLFDRPRHGMVSITGLAGMVKRGTLLAHPERRALKFKQDAAGAFPAALPDGLWDSWATVLKLEMTEK
ncbi:MAG: hypothetical protein MUC91_07700 [Verrucomicrobia bacterium]|nr:hypothetical protein [Verrucomicrobiota bacterium]